MGIKNAASKTIAYAKRNGAGAAFFAALERSYDNHRDNYTYVPLSDAVLNEQKQEYRLLAEAAVTCASALLCHSTILRRSTCAR